MQCTGMLALLAVCLLGSSGAVLRRDLKAQQPAGAGQPEDTMALACEECSKHSEYLDKGGEDCVCHATDIMGTFENDATKTHTATIGTSTTEGGVTSHKNVEETSNIGAERLPEGWMWHCRPITATKGVWQQC